MLDDAQSELEERARALRLEVTVIRKERAVGLVAGSTATASQRLTYECLEELAAEQAARAGAAAEAVRKRKAAATSLAAKRDYPDLTILLMTGFADQRERARGLDAIVTDVLTKPFSLADLRSTVTRALAA